MEQQTQVCTSHTAVDTVVLCSNRTIGSTVQSCREYQFTLCMYITCGFMVEPCACWRRPLSGDSGHGLLLYARGMVVHSRGRCMYVLCHAICVHRLCCLDVSELASLPRSCLPRTDVLGGGAATGGEVEGGAACGWVRVLAAG